MEFIFFLTIALLIIAAYYALVVMPRQYEFKKHQRYVTSMEVGDEVITSGGLIGTITELDAEVGVAKIHFLADCYQALPGIHFAIDGNAILQVAEKNIYLCSQIRGVYSHLRVAWIEEVDHPRGFNRDFSPRFRSAYHFGFKKIAGTS